MAGAALDRLHVHLNMYLVAMSYCYNMCIFNRVRNEINVTFIMKVLVSASAIAITIKIKSGKSHTKYLSCVNTVHIIPHNVTDM